MSDPGAFCSLSEAQRFFWECRTCVNEILNDINISLAKQRNLVPPPTLPSTDIVDEMTQLTVEQKVINDKLNRFFEAIAYFTRTFSGGIKLLEEETLS